jgi:hypothetical protein
MLFYKLDKDGEPVPCNDSENFGLWFDKADRTVAKTIIGEVTISTVFLAIDHSFGGRKPILYETMIFGGQHDMEQWRYSTKEEAIIGHEEAVSLVTGRG